MKPDSMTIGIDCRELCRSELNSLGIHLYRLLPELHQYRLVLFAPGPPALPSMSSDVELITYGKAARGGLSLIRYHAWMKRIMKKRHVDVFYEINHYLPFRIPDVITVAVIHDLHAINGIGNYSAAYRLLYRMLLARTLKNADIVVARSLVTRDDIMRQFNSRPHIYVNPHAIATPLADKSNSAPNDSDSSPSRQYMLSIGRVSRWKGSDRILEIYAEHLAGSGYGLVLAGAIEDHTIEETAKKYIDRGMDIMITGYISNEYRDELLSNCDLFLYPARYDGFGVPPLEAAAMRTKCLMNDLPVLRETLGECGRFVDFYADPMIVAEKIREVLIEDSYPYDSLQEIAASYTIQRCIEGGERILLDYINSIPPQS